MKSFLNFLQMLGAARAAADLSRMGLHAEAMQLMQEFNNRK